MEEKRQDDRRKGERRADITFGTGPALSAEEIERAANFRHCEACGIYHEGRPCKVTNPEAFEAR